MTTNDRKPAKCPWTKPHMRGLVKRAMDKVGGERGFEFVGRGMQEAIIDQACWHAVHTAAQFGSMSFDEMAAVRRTAYEIAGIWDAD